MENFIETWGYWAIFLGAILEGEVTYLTGIVISQLGQLNLSTVVVISFFGAVTRDGILFYLARRGGVKYIERVRYLRQRVVKVSKWLHNRPTYILVFYRLFYGMATALILIMGLSKLPTYRCVLIYLFGSLLWTIGYGLFGFFAARQVLLHISQLKNYGWVIILTVVVVASIYLIVTRLRKRTN